MEIRWRRSGAPEVLGQGGLELRCAAEHSEASLGPALGSPLARFGLCSRLQHNILQGPRSPFPLPRLLVFISVSFWGAEPLLELPGGAGPSAPCASDMEKRTHPSPALAWVAFHPDVFMGFLPSCSFALTPSRSLLPWMIWDCCDLLSITPLRFLALPAAARGCHCLPCWRARSALGASLIYL